MTITLFVNPESFVKFVEVTEILSHLELNNSYEFNPSELSFTEKYHSDWCIVNMPIKDYLKLKYCIDKLKSHESI